MTDTITESKDNDSSSKNIIKQFCELSSFHGIAFLFNAATVLQRSFWILSIICLTSVGIYLIISNTESYVNSRIVTNIDSNTAKLTVSKLTCQHIIPQTNRFFCRIHLKK